MFSGGPQTASLIHQRVETVHGGPHVGTDTFRHTVKTSAPVKLDTQGRAQLTCELESCGITYNFRLLTLKERCKMVLVRALVVMIILVLASLMAQLGTWVYDIGDHSRALRILGDTLTGTGVVINCLIIIWSLMSLWFWPNRYKLEYPHRQYSDTRSGHTVKLS